MEAPLILILIIIIALLPGFVYALPEEGKIVSGSGTINDDGVGNLTVNQTSDKIAIDWQSFSIGNNESVVFMQPNVNASALNNVIGSLTSVIQGSLTANGQVILSNPNGIHIDPGANIDVGSLIASTLNISTQDFINNLYKFAQNPDQPFGFILNEGTIRASDFVAMISPGIENKGVVIANLGTAGAVAGEEVTVDFIGDELINFSISKAVVGTVLDHDGNPISDQINNSGSIQANGGQVILSAASTSEIIKNVINNDGVIEANTVVKKAGKILLLGGDQGIVRVSGTLDASGDGFGEKGGTAHVLGEKVALGKGSLVDVSGDTGGGEALIGGDYQGSNPMILNAERTYIDQEAAINASANTLGDGGKIIAWGNDVNRFYGSIRATGGSNGGDGGFAEVSGKNFLDFQGTTDLSSRYGEIGTLLLDPTNVEVVNTGRTAVTNVDEFGDSGDTVKVNANDLDDASANITIQANNNITVSQEIGLGTSGATLTLTAKNNIVINDDITTTNGAITFTAGNDFISTGLIDSGSAKTTIQMYNGGRIGLGDSDCELFDGCTMSISGTELGLITSTGLEIGGSNTEFVYSSNVAAADTNNVSGTVTFTANKDILIQGTLDEYGALTLNADRDIYLDGDELTTTGNFTATADTNDNGVGTFTIGTGVILDSGGNVTINANQMFYWGTVLASGDISLPDNISFLDVVDLMETAFFGMLEDNAFEALFMDDLGMMMDEFGGGPGGMMGPGMGQGC